MKRRKFVEKFGVGAAVLAPVSALAETDNKSNEDAHEGHAQVQSLAGLLANATVTFGQWNTEPPLDRFPNLSPGGMANMHLVSPREAIIRAGGSINFVIAGLHQVIVYGPGTKPADINITLTVPATGGGPMLINDPANRIYRGLDPSVQPRDRVEAVFFPKPGRYLVICGIPGHFTGGMFGYIRVLR